MIRPALLRKEMPEAWAHRESGAMVARGAFLYGLGTAVTTLSTLFVAVAVSRHLGYDEFGRYTIGLGVSLAVAIVTRVGLDLSSVHFPASHLGRGEDDVAAAQARSALLAAFVGGLLAFVLQWGLAQPAADLLGRPAIGPVARAFAPFAGLFNLIQVAAGALRGTHRATGYVLVRLVAYPALLAACVLASVLFAEDLLATIWATDLAAAAGAAVAVAAFLRTFPGRGALAPPGPLLRFGLSNLALQLLAFGVLGIDIFILGYFRHSETVGYYRVAAQVALVLTVPATAFETLFVPLCSALLARSDLDRLRAAGRSAARIVFCITGMAAIAAVLDPDALFAVFGPNVGPAIPAFVVLATAYTVASSLGPIPYALQLGGRISRLIWANLAALLVVVLAAYALIPSFGLLGAAVATGLGALTRAAIAFFYLHREFRAAPSSGRLALALGGFALVLALGAAWREAHPAPLLVAGAAAVAFGAFSWWAVLTRDDRGTLLSLVGALARRDEPSSAGGGAAAREGRLSERA